jgi:hypothetical protein
VFAPSIRLAERHRAEIAGQAQKSEQKLNDEHGARRHVENNAEADVLASLMSNRSKNGAAA